MQHLHQNYSIRRFINTNNFIIYALILMYSPIGISFLSNNCLYISSDITATFAFDKCHFHLKNVRKLVSFFEFDLIQDNLH